jgi:hypothetical protein
MGLFDDLTPGYTPAPVDVEGAIGRWTAARTASGLSVAGGEIVLTLEHLVFTPWDMTKTREFLVKLLTNVGVPHVGDVDKLLTASRLLEPVAVPLSQISVVQPMGRASWLKPPWARLTFVDGRHLDVGILAGPRRINRDPANNTAFDDWLAKLRAQQRHDQGPVTMRS